MPSLIPTIFRSKGGIVQCTLISDCWANLSAPNCCRTTQLRRENCHMPVTISAQPGTSPRSEDVIFKRVFIMWPSGI